MACFLNLPAPIYKRKDVVSKRKTKTYLPPPQPGSLGNNPMLLNAFVDFEFICVKNNPLEALSVGSSFCASKEKHMYLSQKE